MKNRELKYPVIMCGGCNFGCMTFNELINHLVEMAPTPKDQGAYK